MANSNGRFITATTDRLFETVELLLNRPLTEAQRRDLTTRLVGINTNAVAPGDLITADLFNALRADINDLAVRLALVEDGVRTTAAPPIITRIEPAGLRSGEEMTVYGRNLTPARLTLITVGGNDVPISSIVSGGDTVLEFPSPAIPGLAAAGELVQVRIANGAGEAVHSLFIRGATTDALNAGFAFDSPGLRLPSGAQLTGKVTANTDYVLVYTIDASSSRDERFDISPILTTALRGWSARMMSGNEFIQVPRTVGSVPLMVRVLVHTGALGSASVRLRVRGTPDTNVDEESPETEIRIGDTGPVAVSEITFATLKKVVFNEEFSIDGSTVYFGEASGPQYRHEVKFEATVKAPTGVTTSTVYLIGQPKLSGNGWEVKLSMAPGDLTINVPVRGVTQREILLKVNFTGTFNPEAPTASDSTVDIPVTGPGGAPARTMTIYLRRREDHKTPRPD